MRGGHNPVGILLSVALLIGIFIIGFSLYPNNAVYADDVSPSRNVVSKNEPIFKVLAPKNQRKFKHRWTFKRSVKSIKKEGKQLKAYGQRTAIVGGLFVGAKAGVIGAVVTASGSAIYLVGDYQVSSVKKVKKGSKRVIKVDFRWINTKRTGPDSCLIPTGWNRLAKIWNVPYFGSKHILPATSGGSRSAETRIRKISGFIFPVAQGPCRLSDSDCKESTGKTGNRKTCTCTARCHGTSFVETEVPSFCWTDTIFYKKREYFSLFFLFAILFFHTKTVQINVVCTGW